MIICQITYQRKLKKQYAFDLTKILIDTDDKLSDYITLKKIVILITE